LGALGGWNLGVELGFGLGVLAGGGLCGGW